MTPPRKYGPNLLVVGITGGIGSGKSTVLDMLARRGLTVVKADDVAHTVVLPGTPAYRQIVEHFGDEVITADGMLDRRHLGDIVFADLKELAALNRIVHPPVIDQLKQCFTEIAASGDRMSVAVEIPLLVEAGLVDAVDRVVLVTAPREVRLARMIGQGWPERRVRAVMEAQASDAEKAKHADVVIENSGTMEQLEEKVAELLDEVADGAVA